MVILIYLLLLLLFFFFAIWVAKWELLSILQIEACFKIVIYNYVLCWLYSMTKSVVITLILFLVFLWNFIEPCDISQQSRTQCIQIHDIMNHNLTLFLRIPDFFLLALCKVVIYNYVLCWLYSMTKSVVIALIYFLVFCEILFHWV